VVGHGIEGLTAGMGSLGSLVTTGLEGGVGLVAGGGLLALTSLGRRRRPTSPPN